MNERLEYFTEIFQYLIVSRIFTNAPFCTVKRRNAAQKTICVRLTISITSIVWPNYRYYIKTFTRKMNTSGITEHPVNSTS